MQVVATIFGFSLATLLVLVSSAWSAASAQEPTSTPRKLDEFGSLRYCDLSARLDNFHVMLQTTPGAEATVIAYGPDGHLPGAAGQSLERIKDYLVNIRGIDPAQLKTVYGGRNSDLKQPKVELWVVPKGAAQPEPEKHESSVETFQGLFDDREVDDNFDLFFEDEVGAGLASTTDASFVDILQQQQKSAVGYVVVYSGADLTPGAWRRLGQRQIDHFKSFNIDSSRLKLIFGGHQKESRMQLWILPKNAPPPVREAKELPQANAIKAGYFSEASLRDERNQKAVLTQLVDILRVDKTVRAFVVVRIQPPGTEEVSTVEELAADPVSEPDPVDLTKLVEKWRLELTITHKISAERLIILFTTAPEHGSSVGLWIVPKGQPLPDPKADEEEAEPEPEP
jgi:hypothetical protein